MNNEERFRYVILSMVALTLLSWTLLKSSEGLETPVVTDSEEGAADSMPLETPRAAISAEQPRASDRMSAPRVPLADSDWERRIAVTRSVREPAIRLPVTKVKIGFLRLLPITYRGRWPRYFDRERSKERCLWLRRYIRPYDLDFILFVPEIRSSPSKEIQNVDYDIAVFLVGEVQYLLEMAQGHQYNLCYTPNRVRPWVFLRRASNEFRVKFGFSISNDLDTELEIYGYRPPVVLKFLNGVARTEWRLKSKTLQTPVHVLSANFRQLPTLPPQLSRDSLQLELIRGLTKPTGWKSLLAKTAVSCSGPRQLKAEVSIGQYEISSDAESVAERQAIVSSHLKYCGRNVLLVITLSFQSK